MNPDPADETSTPSLVNAEPIALGQFKVGRLAVGCARWSFQDARSIGRLIDAAADVGVSLIDTADVYGGDAGPGRSEELLGEVFAASRGRRGRFVIAGKAGIVPGVPYNSSPDHLMKSCEASLRRLRCDALDLFQVHRPDLFTHPADVAGALARLVEQGKVRAVGVSNYTPPQLDALATFLPVPVVSTSPEISLCNLSALRDGRLEQASRLDLAVLAWGPLAKGRITRGESVGKELLDVIDAVAQREGVGRSAVAVAFVLALPGKIVSLIGTTRIDRFLSAARATSVHLNRTDVYRLIQAAEGGYFP